MTQHATPDPSADDIARMSRPPSSRTVCRQAPARGGAGPGLPGQPHQDPRRAADAVQGQADQYRAGQGRLRQQAQRRRGARGLCRAPHLETALAREFTARARPADFRRIEAHLARERQALESGDAQARNRLLGDFHLLLAEIVGNQVLTDMLRELLARSAVITALYQSTHDAGCSSREHRAFIQAARKGDADAASALMDEHLRHAGRPDFQAGAQGDADLVTALLR